MLWAALASTAGSLPAGFAAEGALSALVTASLTAALPLLSMLCFGGSAGASPAGVAVDTSALRIADSAVGSCVAGALLSPDGAPGASAESGAAASGAPEGFVGVKGA